MGRATRWEIIKIKINGFIIRNITRPVYYIYERYQTRKMDLDQVYKHHKSKPWYYRNPHSDWLNIAPIYPKQIIEYLESQVHNKSLNNYRLRELIEALDNVVDKKYSKRKTELLLSYLDHPCDMVKEGAIYSSSDHIRYGIIKYKADEVKKKVEYLRDNDPNLVVRELAKEALED